MSGKFNSDSHWKNEWSLAILEGLNTNILKDDSFVRTIKRLILKRQYLR